MQRIVWAELEPWVVEDGDYTDLVTGSVLHSVGIQLSGRRITDDLGVEPGIEELPASGTGSIGRTYRVRGIAGAAVESRTAGRYPTYLGAGFLLSVDGLKFRTLALGTHPSPTSPRQRT